MLVSPIATDDVGGVRGLTSGSVAAFFNVGRRQQFPPKCGPRGRSGGPSRRPACRIGRAAENGVYGQSGGDKRDKRASRINGNKRVINGK